MSRTNGDMFDRSGGPLGLLPTGMPRPPDGYPDDVTPGAHRSERLEDATITTSKRAHPMGIHSSCEGVRTSPDAATVANPALVESGVGLWRRGTGIDFDWHCPLQLGQRHECLGWAARNRKTRSLSWAAPTGCMNADRLLEMQKEEDLQGRPCRGSRRIRPPRPRTSTASSPA